MSNNEPIYLNSWRKPSFNQSLRLIKAWVKNDFRLQCPPSKVRGIRVDCASNHSYLESRSCSSWTAPPFWSVGFALVFPIFAGESDNLEEDIKRR